MDIEITVSIMIWSWQGPHFYFRKANSHTREPRSWFGPNGQYIRELPCPSCRGRGYTPCTECGIERSRSDCPKCNGKVLSFRGYICSLNKIQFQLGLIRRV